METIANSINFATLEKIRALQGEGEPDIVQEFIELYVSKTPLLVEKLRAAIGLGDLKDIRYLSHTIKGSSALLGAVAMTEISATLEEHSYKGSLEGNERLLRQLETELKNVINQFHTILQVEYV